MTKQRLAELIRKSIDDLGIFDKKPDDWSWPDFEDLADEILSYQEREVEKKAVPGE